MKNFLVWAELVLVVGGCLVGMLGLLWYKAGRLLEFFNFNLLPEPGFKVAMAGLAMVAVGFGLVYLTR